MTIWEISFFHLKRFEANLSVNDPSPLCFILKVSKIEEITPIFQIEDANSASHPPVVQIEDIHVARVVFQGGSRDS